jgi:2-polyprenyl-3-methyl-5-hydroxy-6-metoxy-1,4-benzoquinol methylase
MLEPNSRVMHDDDCLYDDLAAAYVRGKLPEIAHDLKREELLALGRRVGLKLRRFKRNELPRVRAVLGILRGIAPRTLLDIGSGRGAFLWPLLDAFPELPLTAVEPDAQRRDHIDAVRRGGIDRLNVLAGNAQELAYADGVFDVVTVLEVLEHQIQPLSLAQMAMRVAKRFVVVSVPSTPDENPEHVQLFTNATLPKLLREAGAANVSMDYVLNHIIAIARVDRQ